MPLTYTGLDRDLSDQFGRRVAIALEHGNWEQAHDIIRSAQSTYEEATRETRPVDVYEINLVNTKIPLRIVGLLEKHGMLTVGDLLLVGLDFVATRRHIGPESVETILIALREFGLTRDHFGGNHG